MIQRNWNVCVSDPSETSLFAAEEFCRLLSRMDPGAVVKVSKNDLTPAKDALVIGLGSVASKAPAVQDPAVDDSIFIHVQNCAGVITGANERSVLIALYRFFREAGCVFVRPGRDGEFIPQKESAELCVHVCETPAYRHRGICLEGACSYENVVDMIDWAPKMGFNEYFTQLFRPAWTFRRWYEHYSNPTLTPSPVSNETIDAFVKDFGREISRRGLLHHRIGHGWASRILGFVSGAWHELNDETKILPGRESLIASIDGKRCLFKGSGIDTNLCYSDPKVQSLMVEEVVSYAKENPSLRYLHFWFADTVNNQCECENCQKARPADFYVQILNQIDRRLTEEGLETKIVFLIYLDLLWEPEKEAIRNPDRFVLLYAPIRRSYSVPLYSDSGKEEAPYKRNGFVPTPGAGDTLPYLHAWQKTFPGDSCIFDYHYMWDYINDPGCYKSVQIMAQDVEDFRKLGLNGFISCQNMRVFMPNGLGMNLMGSALWTGKEGFGDRAPAYFEAAYGKNGKACMHFFRELSDLFDPTVLRGETPVRDPKIAEKYEKIPALIDSFLPVIRRALDETKGVQFRSWECLSFYAELCRRTAKVLYHAARGEKKDLDESWKIARAFACENETRFQREFDVFEFILVWESKILNRIKEQEEQFIE